MIIRLAELSLLLLIAVCMDIKTNKIKNCLTYPAALIGLITSLILFGAAGLKDSLSGILVPCIILFIFYALRMMGAGDLKLFGAIGAIMGLKVALCTVIYAFLSGGVIAIILISVRKNAIKRFKHLFNYLKLCFIISKLERYQEFDNNSGLFKFSYAILGGAAITLLDGLNLHILLVL